MRQELKSLQQRGLFVIFTQFPINAHYHDSNLATFAGAKEVKKADNTNGGGGGYYDYGFILLCSFRHCSIVLVS